MNYDIHSPVNYIFKIDSLLLNNRCPGIQGIKEVRIGNKAIVVGLQFSTKFSSGSIISLRTDFYAPCM